MTKEQLTIVLERMTGHLVPGQQEKQLQAAREKLAASILKEQPGDTGSEQLFANSDLHSRDHIASTQLEAIANIAGNVMKTALDKEDPDQFFIRSTPVLNALVAGSVPEWAIGSKPSSTYGPFLNSEGRETWIDFYKVEKLITLYIGTQPVLLFKASFRSPRLLIPNALPLELSTTYELVAGSCWIHASLLATDAPVEKFAGVEISGGTIRLSEAPVVQNAKLIVKANTHIQLALQLVQGKDAGAASTSLYGKDSRDANYILPVNWEFSIQSNKASIQVLSSSKAELFGQSIGFEFEAGNNGVIHYDNGQVLIPWKASEELFNISTSLSSWAIISGHAAIKKACWALPSASLDIASPVLAHGNGAIWLQLDKGLSADWTGLENEEARLIKPVILAGPGNISVIDTVCNMMGASQRVGLWKDELNTFGSDAVLLYKEKTPFLFTSISETGIESVITSADADIHADRPVKVNGECFPIHARTASVMLAATTEKRLFFVFAEELDKEQTTTIAVAVAVKPVIKRESIALENGLFTVSPVIAFILFGEADKDWKKLSRANLFLSFYLFSYLPTLPDPYVANLGRWRPLFERRGGRLDSIDQSLLLIGAVRYTALNENTDDVQTSFYFGGQGIPGFTDLLEQPVEEDTAPVPDMPAPTPAKKTTTARFGVMKSRSTVNIKQLVGVLKDKPVVVKPGTAVPKTDPQFTIPLAEGFQDGEGRDYSYEELQKMGRNTEDLYDDALQLKNEFFSLLDVSSNANQLGISFGTDVTMIKTGTVRQTRDEQYSVAYNAAAGTTNFPFIVEGMQVKLPGNRVRAFTLPLMAWEPEINQTPPDTDNPDDPNSPRLMMDPEAGPLYYANDGGPSRFWNNNFQPVPLAPIPVVDALIKKFTEQPDNYTLAAITLPFGMKAIAYLSKSFEETVDPGINNMRPKFREDENGDFKFEGGIQLSLTAGNFGKKAPDPKDNDGLMFPGYTIQFNNLLNFIGQPSAASNLGHRVTQIFNNEFFLAPLKTPSLKLSRGVPVSRIDITGYGANMFSTWFSPSAAIAQTSQARFDVMMGRTGHEVIQVRSILYPWGIRVVRTITVFRAPSGYVYRTDSGWKAESDGLFDFSFKVLKENVDPYGELKDTDFTDIVAPDYITSPLYEFHPGVIRGLFNVRNIKDTASVAEFSTRNSIKDNKPYINGVKGQIMKNTFGDFEETVTCGPVYFDADIEIENVVQGSINGAQDKDLGDGKKTKYGRVVSKKILGYVQTAPAGKPLTPKQLAALLNFQNGSIGGDLNCEVNINQSNQQMHINRFDVSPSVGEDGSSPVFVVAARGQVFLPKDGSWSMVQHDAASGVVTQLPKDITVPLIRTGKWIKNDVIDPTAVKKSLARIAHPLEISRAAGNTAINFGFLQITGTQKALFLTPAYGLTVNKLLSRTPPVFADAYRLMTGNSIFPNIGNAIDNFGSAMAMLNVLDSAGNEVKAFADNALTDAGTKALEVMDILSNKTGDTVIEQGMKLLQKRSGDALDKALEFAVPQLSEPIYLVKTDALKIYIEYKAKPKGEGDKRGKLDFDIDSFSGEMDKQWKSRMNNLSMVVDLSDMKRIMIIKGNFDSKKGKESNYEGGPDTGSDLPTPEIEFGDALKPVVDLLTVLSELSTGDYASAMKKGLKIAMSNSGEIWEYKFEASKEIALVRFPPTDEAYNSAQTPLKLEASMGIGVYFNAALKVTTDPTQLLPTAGAFLKFHGGLSVMCFSVGVASVYAIGSVDVKLSADTKVGPGIDLKFGFGVSIVVSLPVVGNASVTYMMAIEMHADSQKVIVAVLMLFRGQANLLAGLVCVTITIEAKGIMTRENNETTCTAQVTFAIDISIFLVIDINFSKTWGETRGIA